jgi:tetratricopeptide (TPR) repeat protein
MPSILGKLLKRKTAAPNQFDALYVQAISAAATEDFQRAIELYDQAIALNPSHAEAYYKRGNALKNLGRLDAVIASYDQAIERRPDYAYAYCNRGVVQQSLGLTAAALSSYDQAITLDATDAMAHYNRALLMQDCSQWKAALASYNQAILVDPGFADAQYNRSLALLFQGDFENGWRSYEWRWKNAQRLSIGEPRNFTEPLWLGEESIAGKRLLLYSEGGLGRHPAVLPVRNVERRPRRDSISRSAAAAAQFARQSGRRIASDRRREPFTALRLSMPVDESAAGVQNLSRLHPRPPEIFA